jgi:Gram-negative porin
MLSRGVKGAGIAGALSVIVVALTPALGAFDGMPSGRHLRGLESSIGSFTPAAADPKLAALLARDGITGSGFRFTPSVASDKKRAVTVAVRARAVRSNAVAIDAISPAAPTVGVGTVSYDLGASVGWKRFALTGDVRRVDTGLLPGSRVSADVGVSYTTKKWSTHLQVAAERPVGNVPRTLAGSESLSLDVGGSYRLTRNFDVTAGVRYKTERDRLDRIQDNRRDSQAVYVGTAFRF